MAICNDVKLFTAILLLAPAFFMAEGVYFASAGMAVLFAWVIVLCSLTCLAWGCWIFRRHRKLACLCIASAILYLMVLALLLLPANAATANKARAANPATASRFHAGGQWRGVADARRSAEVSQI